MITLTRLESHVHHVLIEVTIDIIPELHATQKKSKTNSSRASVNTTLTDPCMHAPTKMLVMRSYPSD
jgi:hypothetical protein